MSTYLVHEVRLDKQVDQGHQGHGSEQGHQSSAKEQPAATVCQHGRNGEAHKDKSGSQQSSHNDWRIKNTDILQKWAHAHTWNVQHILKCC